MGMVSNSTDPATKRPIIKDSLWECRQVFEEWQAGMCILFKMCFRVLYLHHSSWALEICIFIFSRFQPIFSESLMYTRALCSGGRDTQIIKIPDTSPGPREPQDYCRWAEPTPPLHQKKKKKKMRHLLFLFPKPRTPACNQFCECRSLPTRSLCQSLL